MKEKKVAIVVVTYNRKILLKECLNALINQEYENFIVIIVDNGSTDNTHDEIKPLLDDNNQLFYFNTGYNLGGAGGFNYGMRIAAEQYDTDYICLMDDDTIVSSTAIVELINAADILKDDFGFLSSYVEYTDGSYCLMNTPSLNRDGWLKYRQYLGDGIISITRATFVSFFVKKETVVEYGLPIKEFFIWSDDREYSTRLSKKLPCYFVNESIVVHKMGKNSGADTKSFLTDGSDRIARYSMKYRNQFYIAKRDGIKDVFTYLAKFIGLNFLIVFKGKNKRMQKLYFAWKGFIQGIFFNPSIEYINPEIKIK